MSDPTFRPCRWRTSWTLAPTEEAQLCKAPTPGKAAGTARIIGPYDCAACPIPQAEAELRERTISRLLSLCSDSILARAGVVDLIVAVVQEELPE